MGKLQVTISSNLPFVGRHRNDGLAVSGSSHVVSASTRLWVGVEGRGRVGIAGVGVMVGQAPRGVCRCG